MAIERAVVRAAASDVEGAEAGSFINKALAKVDSVLTEAGSIVSNATDAVLTIAVSTTPPNFRVQSTTTVRLKSKVLRALPLQTVS